MQDPKTTEAQAVPLDADPAGVPQSAPCAAASPTAPVAEGDEQDIEELEFDDVQLIESKVFA